MKKYDITSFAVNDIYPHITFWLDLPPTQAFERKMGADNDRFEQIGMEFHNSVYNAYKKLSEMYPNRIKRIDASKSKEEVSTQIAEYLNDYFFSKQSIEERAKRFIITEITLLDEK